MEQETGAVDDSKGQQQLGGLIKDRVVVRGEELSELARRLCEVFS